MISVEEALKLVEANIPRGKTELKAVSNSLGFTLAKDLISPINMPPFQQSAMDGYALNLNNSSKIYTLIGEVAAGSGQKFELKKGEAVRIFTGAAVPLSATTVIRQEDVEVNGTKISFTVDVQQNANIRPLGEQIKIGETALKKGTKINSGILGYLSTLGLTAVEVYSKPKVAIITTGDELVKPGQDLKLGQIYESNSAMLEAAFSENGIAEVTQIKVKDEYQRTFDTLKTAIESHDFIIVSGGISVGDYDFVGKALHNLEVEQVFYKVKQKPGKPLFFGKKDNKIIFALPGNPAAALTSFYVYIYPALQKYQGGEFIGCKRISLPIANDYQRKAQRSEFLKGKITNGKLYVLGAQSSAMLSSFAEADCFIYVSEAVSGYHQGDAVECLLM